MNRKEIEIFASDDLVTRSRKIVEALGFRGDVGNAVLDVYDILNGHQKLDNLVAEKEKQ